ncbi:MAG: DUF3429 domain-containing protein [Pseudomonadota bacterium]
MAEPAPDFRLSAVPPAARALGLAGLIPFLALAAAALFGPAEAVAPARALLAAYGAVILSFMGGCRWGFASAGLGEGPRWWPLGVSVIPALLAFAALAVDGARGAPGALVVLALGLIALFGADVSLTRAAGAPAWWPGLRLPLTLGAALCLLAGLAA